MTQVNTDFNWKEKDSLSLLLSLSFSLSASLSLWRKKGNVREEISRKFKNVSSVFPNHNRMEGKYLVKQRIALLWKIL